MDIATWLRELDLGDYAETFRANRIDAEVLRTLTAEDLKELGIAALGDRKRLMAAIARLDGAGAAPAEPASLAATPAAKPSEDGERRQVTVLFADIAGFTAMSERLGAEATHAVLNQYFEAADRIVVEFGGSVDKHMGDNVMAVFGAPVAHDNDPERAVRAALAIHEAAAAIEAGGAPLALHVGIASGQVVASGTGSDSHREYTVIGDSVNLAARLQGLAGPGQTLISEEVERRTRGRFATAAMGPQPLKGIERPVPVFRVEGRAEAAAAARPTPFVGRRAELGQCRALLDEVAATGRGCAILLRGPAGIGKTRLTEEIAAAARRSGFALHRCLVLDFGSGKGQDPVPALVRSLLGLPPSSAKEQRRLAAEAAQAAGAFGAAEAPFAADLLDLPQPAESARLFDAMDDAARRAGRRRLLAGLVAWAARTAPCLLLVEDLHWADAVTLDLLAVVVAAARESAVAFLGTTRPEGDPLEGAWRALSLEHPVSMIGLGPLREDEARAMAAGFARAESGLLARCLDRAAGNPLFLEQLIQNAAESTSAALPGTIQSLVLARMDRLDAASKRALQAAAVLGQRFGLGALRQLAGDPTLDCGALMRHQLVRPEGADYLFTHALIRDGVYESILGPARRRLHLAAAGWFAGSDPVLRAEHLRLAGDPEAAGAYLTAARGELARYRNAQAVALLEAGHALAAEPGLRTEICLALGEARLDAGRTEAARGAFDEALAGAMDDAARCRARLGLAAVKRVTDDLDGALADLDAATALATGLGLVAEQARAHSLRGNMLFPLGDVEGSLRAHGAALVMARQAGLVALEASALSGIADAEYMRGRFLSAFRRFTECVELSRAHGLGRTEAANLSMVAITALWTTNPEIALDWALEAVEATRRIGHGRAEMVAHHAAFLCYKSRAELGPARIHIEQAIKIARRLGAKRFEAEGLLFRAEIEFAEGDRERAVADAHDAVGMSRKFGFVAYMGPSMLGVLALVSDDEAEWRAALAEGEALLSKGSVSHNHVFYRTYAIDACLRRGEHDEAERHADALAAYTAPEELPVAELFVGRGRALARLGRGERSAVLAAELDRLIARGEASMQHLAVRGLREGRAVLREL